MIFATGNRHKLRELRELLPGVELEPLPEGVDAAARGRASRSPRSRWTRRGPSHEATGGEVVADDSGIGAVGLDGRPGIHSARYGGEGASDEENLDKLLREVAAAGDERRAFYTCALALIEEDGTRARLRGALGGAPGRGAARQRRLRLRPRLRPRRHRPRRPAHRLRAERRGEERDQPSRPGGADAGRAPGGQGRGRERAMIRTKSGAAALSIASNSVLIAIKLAAGAITGSIAIITEALHSLIDLIASVIAFVSVRKADEPADADHPYGHEKVESLAAAIEGMLILVGAAVIVYEATRRLAIGAEVDDLGIGIAVMGFSILANLVVSGRPRPPGAGPRIARPRGRRRPPAGRRADLGRRPLRPAARRGDRRRRLRLDHGAGGRRGDRRRRGQDPAPLLGVLVDEALSDGGNGRRSRPRSPPPGPPRSPGTTSCAAGGRAPTATSTSTSSTARGPGSSGPTSSPTRCGPRSRRRCREPRS